MSTNQSIENQRAALARELLARGGDPVTALQAYKDSPLNADLEEICFSPGSDREVSQSNAARVALAMLGYSPAP